MRIDRIRALALTAATTLPFLASAQAAGAAITGEPLIAVDNTLIYSLVALAIVQVIFIASLASIMRTLNGPGSWSQLIGGKDGRLLVLLPLLFAFSAANAQAYKGEGGTISAYHTFWWLVAINGFLFVLLLAQLNMMRGMTRALTGADDAPKESPLPTGPTWEQRVMARLTRQVPMEKEEDIMMHHDYDGIRELDNVLPPWWVYLFYGTIVFAVVYLVNVHVTGMMPDQQQEYKDQMAEAQADVAAYMATLKNIVNENNVTLSTDAATLASGRATFKQYCTPCHGQDAAGSETSVGPNLTDAYWLHGGGVKNVFHTITYGVPEKGMISWKTQLKPIEIAAVASYVLSLQGTGPATQKAPQGDLWKESAAPVDSTGTDSTAAPPDTTKLAAASR